MTYWCQNEVTNGDKLQEQGGSEDQCYRRKERGAARSQEDVEDSYRG